MSTRHIAYLCRRLVATGKGENLILKACKHDEPVWKCNLKAPRLIRKVSIDWLNARVSDILTEGWITGTKG